MPSQHGANQLPATPGIFSGRRIYPMYLPLPTAQGGLVNGTPIDFVMPLGWLYQGIALVMSNTIALSQITKLQVILNNGVAWDIPSASDLDLINQYDGMPAFSSNQTLLVNFFRPRLFSGQMASCLNTGEDGYRMEGGRKIPVKGITNKDGFKLRMTFSGLSGGETLTPYGIVYDSIKGERGAGTVRRMMANTYNIGGAVNNQQIVDLPSKTPQYAFLNRLLVVPSVASSIDQLNLKFKSTEVRLVPVAINDLAAVFQNAIHVPQSGVLYTLDSTDMGYGDKLWPIFADDCNYTLELTTNQATLLTIYSDLFGSL